MTWKPAWRLILPRLYLLFGAVVLATMLAEILLLLFGGTVYPPPLYPGDRIVADEAIGDPLIGWRLPPSTSLVETTDDFSVTYRSNAQGFRSKRAFKDRAKRQRLAFLGDSYTFGTGVEDEETFAALLERDLRGTLAYNFGIGGFGIDQMWLTLRNYVLPLNPDLVILSFIRNDLDRSLSAYRLGYTWFEKPSFRLVDDRLVPMTRDNLPPAVIRWIHRHSRLYRLWRKAEHSLSRRYAVGYRWRLNRAIFEHIRDDCADAGVPLTVVHIPVGKHNPTPMFERELAAMGIAFLDLGPLLPTNADSLYFENDRHLNSAGHRFVARSIGDWLVSMDLARWRRGSGQINPPDPAESEHTAPAD